MIGQVILILYSFTIASTMYVWMGMYYYELHVVNISLSSFAFFSFQ